MWDMSAAAVLSSPQATLPQSSPQARQRMLPLHRRHALAYAAIRLAAALPNAPAVKPSGKAAAALPEGLQG